MSQRDILFITTGPDDALNARLASQTSPVSEGAQDAFDIEVFTHVYDPDLWRAWIDNSADPVLPSGIRASDAAAVLPEFAAVTADAVTAEWAGARALTATSPTDASPMVDKTQPLYRVIDALLPAQQYDVVAAQLDALSKAFRALNLNPLAIVALKKVHERLWGYMDPHSDGYLTGIGGSLVENRVQVFSYTYGRQWRDALASQYNVRVRPQIGADARSFGPGEVLFGLRAEYNSVVGCRPSSGADSIVAPSSCYAPTGEVHRVWWQANGAMSGGHLFPPLHLANAASDILNANDDIFQVGYDRAIPDGSNVYNGRSDGYDWNAALFEPVTRPGTPWRLYVVAPLAWYWAIYFQPQPEFGGLSFVDWARSMSAAEFIRLQRREATRSNAEMANFWNTTVEGLIGQGAVNASMEAANAARRRNNTTTLIGSGTDAVAAAINEAVKETPVIGLIAGVASQVGKVIAEIVSKGSENDKISIDVYGRLMPAFVVFDIYGTKASFDASILRQVPMPPAAPTNTPVVGTVVGDGAPRVGVPTSGGRTSTSTSARRPASVSLAALRNATTAPVQIHGMPWYGGVMIDGVAVDGAWQDSAQTLWQVRAAPGAHTIRVSSPDGTARDFSVTVPAQGVLIEMATGATQAPAPVAQADTGYSLVQGDPAATWSTSTVSPRSPMSPASPASPVSAQGTAGASTGFPWGKVALGVLGVGAVGGGAAYAVHASRKKANKAAKANKRKKA